MRRDMDGTFYNMSEPTSSTIAGIAGWKMLAGAGGAAGLAALVVMLMTRPRSGREWAVGLITTVLGSVFGGAAAIHYFELQPMVHSEIGSVVLIGICFSCGLPAWAIVRWVFTWMEKRRDADIAEVVAEVRRQAGGQA